MLRLLDTSARCRRRHGFIHPTFRRLRECRARRTFAARVRAEFGAELRWKLRATILYKILRKVPRLARSRLFWRGEQCLAQYTPTPASPPAFTPPSAITPAAAPLARRAVRPDRAGRVCSVGHHARAVDRAIGAPVRQLLAGAADFLGHDQTGRAPARAARRRSRLRHRRGGNFSGHHDRGMRSGRHPDSIASTGPESAIRSTSTTATSTTFSAKATTSTTNWSRPSPRERA